MLADVLTAVAVLSLGLAGLASSLPVSGAAAAEGAQLSTATFLAAARLEEVRAAPWTREPAVDRLGLSSDADTAPEAGGAPSFPDEGRLPAPYGGFRRQVRIADCAGGAGCGGIVSPRLRQITIRVTFRPAAATGAAAAEKTIALTTLVAQR